MQKHPANKDEINRLINNRFFEYGHPLRRRSAGMEAFSKLAVMFFDCSDAEFSRYIKKLNKLFIESDKCVLCRAKLMGFLALYHWPRDEEKGLELIKQLARFTIILETRRNFWHEIVGNIKCYLNEKEIAKIKLEELSDIYYYVKENPKCLWS